MATTVPADSTNQWGHLPEDVSSEIDVYETELRRVQAGQMPEKVFLEFRLRHGVYGQRQDGVQMLRIKIPMGLLDVDKMYQLADLSEEYADGVSHITTRQDIQYHFVDINDTPNLMRRLAEVGITTKEACGNVVRNVTCCPDSGVCSDEVFDVTPHAQAMAYFLLRHPDAQNFGRKFKIAFSGCEDHACGLAMMHDIGAVAKVQPVNGESVHGFKVFLGGGLGSLPHQALLYKDFVPADEMLPLAQACSRVFARLGEKKNRAKARMKFLVSRLGIEEFSHLLEEEIARLPEDARWSQELEQAKNDYVDEPLKPGSELTIPENATPEFLRWLDVNVRPQKQPGYSMVEIFLPLGDISADQLRGLAHLCETHVKGTVRTTVSQNLLVRWVANGDLATFYDGLKVLSISAAGAGRLADVTACPGTDSCKLGITSSRGMAAVLQEKFSNGMSDIADRDDLKIKISGCFNSCGQHHIADIGFFGSVQRKGNNTAPVAQVVLGGTTKGNVKSLGLTVGKVATKNAPNVVRKLSDFYSAEKNGDETLADVVDRVGKARIKNELGDLLQIPSYQEDADFYHDSRQPWEYTKNIGVGECAGEIVDQAEFMLEDADRLNFEASLALEREQYQKAAECSRQAIMKAADGILFTRGLLLSDKYNTVDEFRRHFYETGVFWKPFAENFFRVSEEELTGVTPERARQRVEEATLFIEQAQSVYSQS
ncbi:MAG: sulfite reductase [Solibacterales bacterium]|nr:sulfite reductase [Bryobacterales bacterium]|tara:strand:+ start:2348 stop:4483 length:2136 start_codon:yes stop_codon:yes gene_type:complete